VLVKNTKKGKPYVICDRCGVQMFVRKPEGVRRFRVMLGSGPVRGSMRLSRLLELYDYLTARLDEVRKIRRVHGGNSGLDDEEKLLRSQHHQSREVLIKALKDKKRQLQARRRRSAK
jgi:hypothetical protein